MKLSLLEAVVALVKVQKTFPVVALEEHAVEDKIALDPWTLVLMGVDPASSLLQLVTWLHGPLGSSYFFTKGLSVLSLTKNRFSVNFIALLILSSIDQQL
jgi:hypothetical protein